MPHRLTVSVLGALAAASLLAPIAHAGSPAKVSVRVEAPHRTLVDTTLTTTRAQVVKDGNAAHACTGTSAAGALEQATAGTWTASWFDGLGYAVDSIDGVKPASFSQYWTLWLNGRSSTTGVCDTELQAADQLLEFLCTATPDFSSCTNLPLELRMAGFHHGRVVVAVRLLKGDGTSTPVAGAIVRGGAQPVTTAADGSAQVALRDGQSTLRATHDGDVASNLLHCQHGEHGSRCRGRDRIPPSLRVQGVHRGESFALADAPRELDGVARDPGGIASDELRLTRHADGRCAAFVADRGTFRPCKGERGHRFFGVGDRRHWSYLLPRPLRPGDYELVVRATDRAGNTGRQSIRFSVEAV